MSIRDELNAAYKQAMKDKNDIQKIALKDVLAAIKQVEIDERKDLDEAGVMKVVQKEVKSRRESIADAEKAGRDDLKAQAEAEMAVLEAFLPKGLSEDEIAALVDEAIAEAGASSMAEMGNVMKVLMPKVAGRADGGQVSAVVRQKLQG